MKVHGCISQQIEKVFKIYLTSKRKETDLSSVCGKHIAFVVHRFHPLLRPLMRSLFCGGQFSDHCYFGQTYCNELLDNTCREDTEGLKFVKVKSVKNAVSPEVFSSRNYLPFFPSDVTLFLPSDVQWWRILQLNLHFHMPNRIWGCWLPGYKVRQGWVERLHTHLWK